MSCFFFFFHFSLILLKKLLWDKSLLLVAKSCLGVFPRQNSNLINLKVGVNHGFFHVYHFWNFLIFKWTWVCSWSSSKNKNIFKNLSINSINLKMSIYLSISKMCSSLFSQGNQACASITQSVKRSLETQHYQQFISKERAWPLNWRVDLGNQFASLKTTVKFRIFVEE